MEKKVTRVYYIFALLKYIKGFKIYLISAVISKILATASVLITGVLTSYIVGFALMGNPSKISTLCIWVGVMVILTVLLSLFDAYISHDMAFRVLVNLRDKVYEKVDEVAPAAIEDKRSGNIVSTIMNDIAFFEWFFAHMLVEWIAVSIISISCLIFMGIFSVIIPIVIIPFIIVIIAVPVWYSKQADLQGKRVRDSAGELNAEIVDGIQGIKDIISYRGEKNYFNRLFDFCRYHDKADLEYAERGSNEKRFIHLAVDIGGLVSAIAIVLLMINGQLSELWLMPMFVSSAAIFIPLRNAQILSTNYGFIFGACKRVFKLLKLKPMVKDNGKLTEKDVRKNKDTINISFDKVYFSYPLHESNQVLKSFSLAIKEGETTALVAESGGGKTTIARLLQRFWDVHEGSIKINGIDIKDLTVNSLRNLITVVPQEVYLFNDTVRENLLLAKVNATDEEIKEASKKAQADNFINNLLRGYETVIGERGLRLSGGEKQRLSIAQAFLKNSPVLILDEASASLDSENERLINLAVESLKKGRTTIVIAHRLSTIKSADRIVVILNGEVVGDGKYEKLIKNNKYFNLLVGEHYG
ncbi:MAG: ABC transporter ATP-binding protein/permease [Clostridiales bacterium]|nr:ABC transporter ATP-binding protein/permease [Clostridiales bacterium]